MTEFLTMDLALLTKPEVLALLAFAFTASFAGGFMAQAAARATLR